jgi:AraC family transcriptional activator of pobA
MRDAQDLPNFVSSDFGGSQSDFLFDFARLRDSAQLPRPFLHRHEYYHILWMTRAAGEHVIDFEKYPLKDYSVSFLAPGQVHAWTSAVEPEGYIINISPHYFNRIFSGTEESLDVSFFRANPREPVLFLSEQESNGLIPLLLDIEAECRADQMGRRDVVKSLLIILFTRLRRVCPPRRYEPAMQKHQQIVRRYERLIEENFTKTSALRDYAAALAITPRALAHSVKSITGQTPGRLIHDRLVLEAKRLLMETELGISELAYKLNFEDPAYFSRFFRRETGMTPRAFRAQYAAPISVSGERP